MTSSNLVAGNLLAAEGGTAGGGNILMLLIMVVAIILLFIVPARRQKKMQAQLQERHNTMAPGTEVMTNFGLFGTVREINQDESYALLEIAPGSVVKVHLQTVTTVVDATENSDAQKSSSRAIVESADEAEPKNGH